MKKMVFLIVTFLTLFSRSFAGNGDIGSADDGVFSRTETLHEAYNPQSEAMKMADLCEMMTTQTVKTGTCQVKCHRLSENVLAMTVAKKGAVPVTIEFQNEDRTLMTFWGSDRQHEYLNSKNIYMNVWIHYVIIDGISLGLSEGSKTLMNCGVNTNQ